MNILVSCGNFRSEEIIRDKFKSSSLLLKSCIILKMLPFKGSGIYGIRQRTVKRNPLYFPDSIGRIGRINAMLPRN